MQRSILKNRELLLHPAQKDQNQLKELWKTPREYPWDACIAREAYIKQQ
jgi:hypothetical protein